MFEKEDINSWAEFKDWLKRLNERHEGLKAKDSRTYVSKIIFRGQPESKFELATTLQRWVGDGMSVNRYFALINKIRAQIETETGKLWQPPTKDEFLEWLNKSPDLLEDSIPDYSFLAYLRHNGFPSPLLDWTESPFVASFFAFRKAFYREKEPSEEPKRVSIFAFLEWAGKGKSHFGSEPLIYTLRKGTRTHKRHYLQQSRYTVCIKKQDETLYFAEHDKFLKNSDKTPEQDLLWEATLPLKEWREAYKDFQAFNINPYSLFASEESLMETLETNEYEDIV